MYIFFYVCVCTNSKGVTIVCTATLCAIRLTCSVLRSHVLETNTI